MIKADFFSRNGKIKAFEITGHADSGDYGHDIVCAGVSSLVISTANNLKRIGQIDFECVADKNNGGYFKIKVNETDAGKEPVSVLLNGLRFGIMDIASEYPQFVKVNDK